MTHVIKSIEFGGTTLTLETGKVAKQANGSIFITYGETALLCTACSTGKAKPGAPFFPLMCDYQEKFYAAGRIPGSYFRREGRPTEKEVLTSRLIDRPARPLFPDGFMCDTQLIATTMSFDGQNDGDVVAMLGAFAAVAISDIPWGGPVVSVRVGRVEGEFIANPTISQREESDLDLVVAVGPKGLVMVEGQAEFVPEEIMVDALLFAEEVTKPLMALVAELVDEVGKAKFHFEPEPVDQELVAACREAAFDKMASAATIPTKLERYAAVDAVKAEAVAALAERFPERSSDIKSIVSGFKSEFCRDQIVSTGKRLDGRATDEVRAISIELGMLPRAHGSALFTRGETQGIIAVTLGTGSDDQRIELLTGMTNRRFMLHYNFPPFSVGEVKFLRSAGRREVGHGTLARRGMLPALPADEDFPYVLRSVSEITESNGSSSMATVCGTSLAMMDAGVPVSEAVAGIAMGLIKQDGKIAVLSDILGDEDHFGDMDFKVVGSANGISALQMDIKIDGLDRQTLVEAMNQARDGRIHILEKMNEAIASPRPDISEYAPRIFTILIDPDRIRDLIGPGGKHIRGIVSETGAQVNVEDDGTVTVAASDNAVAQKAIELVRMYTAQPEEGQDYEGKVVRVADFGAFVQIAPGMDGLCHISELADGRIDRVSDVCNLGDTLKVRVLNVERNGKIRLSHREAMRAAGLPVPQGKKSEGGGGNRERRGGGREPRGRDRDRRRSRGNRDDRDNRDNKPATEQSPAPQQAEGGEAPSE
ncbi:MAG TPA: polyribonucleotide nucleotidyltransferase [Myxococcales bacterium]|nr:polyribonucleotide nucleotidyltransferase [Myxococcales bacterium]HAN32552.1 polyribonucleotide nucleotidyltransferase [Myxococcales bacterium]